MKKLLPLLLLSLVFVGSAYAEVCDEDSTVQKRNGIVFLPNKTKPFSGQNLCAYDNGQYKVKGEYTLGIKDGKWTNWSKNGIKKTEEIYKLGEIKTRTKFSSENYQPIEIINYSDGHEISSTIWDYYSNGQLKEVEHYKYGIEHGIFTKWYENGQKEGEANFINGQEEGKQILWYENGQKSFEVNMLNGIRHGASTSWYENGQLESEVIFNNGNSVHRTNYHYYYNGQMSSEWNFNEMQELDGKHIEWYENGHKKLETNFIDGDVNGTSTTWYENGQKEQESNYINGKFHGKASIWYENGQLKGEAFYKDEKLHGKISAWYPDGLKKGEGTFIDNVGTATWWHKNGVKSGVTPIKGGETNGIVIGWHENGTKKRSGYFKDSLPNGRQVLFYSQNNQKKLVYHCLDGVPVGEVQGWKLNGESYDAGNFNEGKGVITLHENGNIESEIYFKDGIQVSTIVWSKDSNNRKEIIYSGGWYYPVVYNNQGEFEGDPIWENDIKEPLICSGNLSFI